jgi:hypothetical protein
VVGGCKVVIVTIIFTARVGKIVGIPVIGGHLRGEDRGAGTG